MEKETEVKSVRVDFKCPKCATGYFKQIPSTKHRMMRRADDDYEHKCNNANCGFETELERIYPYIKHKDVKVDQYD